MVIHVFVRKHLIEFATHCQDWLLATRRPFRSPVRRDAHEMPLRQAISRLEGNSSPKFSENPLTEALRGCLIRVAMGGGLNVDAAKRYLESDDWASGFDSVRLEMGRKLQRKRMVKGLQVQRMESGELEIEGQVADAEGSFEEAVVGVWQEGDEWFAEGSCSCGFGTNCEHVAATLLWAAKADRLAAALGGGLRRGSAKWRAGGGRAQKMRRRRLGGQGRKLGVGLAQKWQGEGVYIAVFG